MKILVDLDGVLADIHTPWIGMYNAEYHDNLRLRDITKWDMHKIVKPECGKKIYNYLDNIDLYPRTFPIPGSQNGVKKLQELGTVIFVTSGFFVAKVKWLSDHGYLLDENWKFSKEVVVCSRKDLIKGDIIIDDCQDNLARFSNRILFDQPWNRMSKYPRAHNWEEVIEMVKSIMELADI